MTYFLDDIEVVILDEFEEDYQEYVEVIPADFDAFPRFVLKSRLEVYDND